MTESPKAARRARFAANVERLRSRRELSVSDLAERSQIEPAALESILSGDTEARVETIYRLAGALGIEPGELLGGISWIPAEEHGKGEYRVEDPHDD